MTACDQPIRILWDGDIQGSKPLGGISRYCEGLLDELGQAPNLNLLVLCPKKAPAFRTRAPHLRQISNLDIPIFDRRRLNRFHADIFHSTHYQSTPIDIPLTVQTAFDFIDKRLPIFYSNREGFVAHQTRLLQEAQGVVAISESTRRDVLDFTGIPEEIVTVAYPSLTPPFRLPVPQPDEKVATTRQVTGGAPFLLWVGPRNGYKNFTTFFKAFARVANDLDLHLVIVGGEFPRLNSEENNLAISHGICDRVHPLHQVDDARLRLLYASAICLVQASLWEGFGIPLIECLSCGGNLLISDIPVFHEVAGKHARYADPANADAWEDAIRSQTANTDTPSPEIKLEIEKRFDPKSAAENVHGLYRRLLS